MSPLPLTASLQLTANRTDGIIRKTGMKTDWFLWLKCCELYQLSFFQDLKKEHLVISILSLLNP